MLPNKLKSKWWRLNHLYKIKNKEGQLVTFKPNPMQLKHRVNSAGFRYVYLVKPRQFGFTTDYAIDMLDDACFSQGSSGGIIAHDRETLTKIFGIIKLAYDNMPQPLKPITKYDTRNELKFLRRYDGLSLNNDLYVALTIRGTTVQRLHVSEAAHIKDRSELKMGAKQAVGKHGRITEETTGNGLEEFYDDVMFALKKQSEGNLTEYDYRVFFYAWFENPEYELPGVLPGPNVAMYNDEEILRTKYKLTDGQLLWRRWKLDEFRTSAGNVIGLNVFQRFKQEYPATLMEAFQSGAGSVFDIEQVEAIQSRPSFTLTQIMQWFEAKKKPYITPIEASMWLEKINEFARLQKLGVQFWKLPSENRKYVIGVDPSDGQGADSGCIDVWDKDSVEQVAQFYGKMRPDDLAQLAADLGTFYNKAFIGVENNMLSTILFLSKIYDNYYFTVTVDEKSAKRTKKLGWNTNSKTRDLMIDDFIIAFEDGSAKINSIVTKGEMRTFVKKDNGKREHANGKNDDALFGGFIALQMRRFYPRLARVFGTRPAGL